MKHVAAHRSPKSADVDNRLRTRIITLSEHGDLNHLVFDIVQIARALFDRYDDASATIADVPVRDILDLKDVLEAFK